MFQATTWAEIRDIPTNTRFMKAFTAEKITLFNELGCIAQATYSKVYSSVPIVWKPVEHA